MQKTAFAPRVTQPRAHVGYPEHFGDHRSVFDCYLSHYFLEFIYRSTVVNISNAKFPQIEDSKLQLCSTSKEIALIGNENERASDSPAVILIDLGGSNVASFPAATSSLYCASVTFSGEPIANHLG